QPLFIDLRVDRNARRLKLSLLIEFLMGQGFRIGYSASLKDFQKYARPGAFGKGKGLALFVLAQEQINHLIVRSDLVLEEPFLVLYTAENPLAPILDCVNRIVKRPLSFIRPVQE